MLKFLSDKVSKRTKVYCCVSKGGKYQLIGNITLIKGIITKSAMQNYNNQLAYEKYHEFPYFLHSKEYSQVKRLVSDIFSQTEQLFNHYSTNPEYSCKYTFRANTTDIEIPYADLKKINRKCDAMNAELESELAIALNKLIMHLIPLAQNNTKLAELIPRNLLAELLAINNKGIY